MFTQIHTNLVPSRHRSLYVCVCFCWFACFFFRIVYSRMYTLVSIARRERQIFNTVIILRISVCECVVYMFCVSFTTFFCFHKYLSSLFSASIHNSLLHFAIMPVCFSVRCFFLLIFIFIFFVVFNTHTCLPIEYLFLGFVFCNFGADFTFIFLLRV